MLGLNAIEDILALDTVLDDTVDDSSGLYVRWYYSR